MHRAMLLIGPTGSGKTPLGRALEAGGLGETVCLHFDFGAQLRRVAAGEFGQDLTPEQVAVVRRVLETRALLEDRHFPIALRLLRAFLARRGARTSDVIVLNGLPRHEGQARRLQGLLRVDPLVHFACDESTILERIGTDAGGDRAERTDDSPDDVREKLRIFRERTAPLIDFYRRAGSRVLELPVEAGDGGEDARRRLLARIGGSAGLH